MLISRYLGAVRDGGESHDGLVVDRSSTQGQVCTTCPLL
jgi:hypothetical protein